MTVKAVKAPLRHQMAKRRFNLHNIGSGSKIRCTLESGKHPPKAKVSALR